MKDGSGLDRRSFLRVSAVVGGGLVIGIYLPACQPTSTTEPAASSTPTKEPLPTLTGPDQFAPAAFVRLSTDGSVTITVPRSEMGQGVRTALPMILADELDVDWASVQVEVADADTQYVYGDQSTGGSTSISTFYMPFRRAGAVARDMLLGAAAQVWGIDKSLCQSDQGQVIRTDTKDTLAYAYLVPLAASIPPPKSTQGLLKDESEFRIVGTRVSRIDGPEIVNGSAVFGIDVQRQGMVYAVVARSPAIDGHVKDYDDSQARLVAGVEQVVPLDDAVAVVADSTWSALEGRRQLKLTLSGGGTATFDSAEEEAKLRAALDVEPGPQELIAYYVVPFYSHAPMEPMNCIVDARPDRCEAWVSTQDPQRLKHTLLSKTGLPDDKVVVHVPLLGGGFGRRLDNNSPIPYVTEAVDISMKVGKPVKLMWTREEDIQHDYYHPLSVTRVQASLATIGRPALTRRESTSVPTGAWRSVSNVPEAFARECFTDEYASALGQDPLELRRSLYPNGAARAVIDLAADKSGWGTPLPVGRGRGLAYHATWGVTQVAQVAEVSVDAGGQVIVHRVICAVACGQVINPDMVEAQMEGGIVFGLTSALKESITITGGQVHQSNFDDYPLLRLDETPAIEVYIVPSNDAPTGIGEMANPVIAPAVANAVFAATGMRVRRLPIRLSRLD